MSDANVLPYEAESSRSSGLVTQTLALLNDAYRDLQSRKLFWITLVLSVLVSGVFAFVGITNEGIVIFTKTMRGTPFNALLISPADFYKLIFTSLAIPVWLGFLSAILALVAVGGIFPEAISSGSIDLYLSRPIGRLRLFLTKYLFGLLFTAFQVLIFSTVCFLIIGFRGGAWELGIFLAVPLVTLFFSYLYCVCVLVGIVTRSALAAILITGLFWGFLYVIHTADGFLTGFAAAANARVDQQEQRIAGNEKLIQTNEALPPERRGNMSAFEFQRDRQKELLTEYEQTAASLNWYRNLVLGIKAPMPKTNETISLMARYLVRPGALDAVEQNERERRQQREAQRAARGPMGPFGGPTSASADRPQNLRQAMNPDEMDRQIQQEMSARDLPWIVGTSLGFEAVVLGLAAWIFCRRDF